jgi:hypothetical protein
VTERGNSTTAARVGGLLTLVAALCGNALDAEAQLRPYEPVEWRLYDGDHSVSGSIGVARFDEQRASLAGEIGRLDELGVFSAYYRTGRVILGAEGTVSRRFEREETFAPPLDGTADDADGIRRDAGDYRVSTTVRVTPDDWPAIGVVKFGTRLPTTDNHAGLERDQLDFFAVLGGRVDVGPIRSAAEAGLGIHGTRYPEFEQSDVVVYTVSVGLPNLPVSPSLILTGHADGLEGWNIRGNEELSELRVRLRSTGRFWLQVEGIVGLTDVSPRRGISLNLGATF